MHSPIVEFLENVAAHAGTGTTSDGMTEHEALCAEPHIHNPSKEEQPTHLNGVPILRFPIDNIEDLLG